MTNDSTTNSKKKLFEFARHQNGLFTTKQAEEAGYSRKHHSYHVKAGNWVRELRGIYRLAQFPQDDEDVQLTLWYLWSRDRNETPQGVYSHDTALRIYELSDIMPEKLHMTVPKNFRRFHDLPKILTIYKNDLERIDLRLMRGFATTTPKKTLLDLIQSEHFERSIIMDIFEEALQKGMLNPKEEEEIRKLL